MNLFKDPKRAAIFTLFLNSKGKILFDSIIAKPLLANQKADDMEYWVDVEKNDSEQLTKHLKVVIIQI